MHFLALFLSFLSGLSLSQTALASDPMARALSSILGHPCTVVFLDLPPLLIKVQKYFFLADHFSQDFLCLSPLFQGILDNYENYKGASATFFLQDSFRQNVSRLSLLNQQADGLQRCLIGVAWTENASWKTNRTKSKIL